MPREPANPFGFKWTAVAIEVVLAGPPPGAGLMWPFGPWDTCWWPAAANELPVAANDER